MRAAAVILAAGVGARVGAGRNKALLPLAGSPVFLWSVRTALSVPGVDRVLLVTRPGEEDDLRAAVESAPAQPVDRDRRGRVPEVEYVEGGAVRHQSEWHALRALAAAIDKGSIDVVAIHDAARPLADTALWRQVLQAADEHGGALPTRQQSALVHADGTPVEERLVAVQTPQAFRARPLLDAYRRADEDGFEGTDTASCLERYTDVPIHVVPAPATNLKITFPEDVAVAERLLATVPQS